MATRRSRTGEDPPSSTTDYVLHTKFSLSAEQKQGVSDMAEHRLYRMTVAERDPTRKEILKKLLADYRRGLVAVAWRRGLPLWIEVTRDTRQ